MGHFLSEEKKSFLAFVRESKLLLLVTLFFVFLSYGIKIVNYDFSIDTEFILNNYAGQLSAWQSIDRIGLVFTKKLFFNGFNPFVANLLTYFTLVVVCFILCYLVQRILNNHAKKISLVVIPILFSTHPIFAEQFNFVLQGFEVVFAVLLLVIALLCSFYYVETNYKSFALLSILLSAWGFLTYQSLLLLYVAGTIGTILLMIYGHEKENQVKRLKVYFLIVFKYIFIFLTSYVFSRVLVFVTAKLTGIASTSYLSRQILWGKLPLQEVLDNIEEQISLVVFAKNLFYNYSFLISFSIIAIFLVWKIINKSKTVYLEVVGFIFLFLSPFLLTMFIGQAEAIRAQMPALQFVIAFNFYYICLHLGNKWIKNALIAFCFMIAFNQSNITAKLLFSEHVKFQEDVNLANRINYQLDSLGVGNRSDYSLVILGKHEPESILNIQGELLGHSFFAWDVGTKAGTTMRAIGFMRTLGYRFKDPTEEQVDYARSIANEMELWPNKGSIRIFKDVIIVRLSADYN
ncbi:hypothetical protein CVD25_22485 [Bacillus canaveralius]|uniref:Glucosyl transferase GtrII n=1 Tax=Bacillus canaveralius TaxID=1403243 RepID=A0A2N5GI54_9BACI|nr:glucosyltransferase domain-containing protein [Bacillus canaveralius]PLR80622.1 hypothetical protein CU635_17610 [Bacillus canaveralius]PLR88526.1 hypothetical protein CVD25_22485 [Bacillus canaveralius]RSK54148.1 hypothetical protein EJA13_06105 [Bacillus canaveralius]